MLVVWSSPPSRPRRIAVFDLDGVVVDSEARLRAALEAVGAEGLGGLRGAARRRFWEVFLSEELLDLDRPNPAGVEAVCREYVSGSLVAIVTGRPVRLAAATLRMLREWRVPWHVAVFRGEGDFSRDAVFKERVVRLLFGVVDVVHDDSVAVVEELVEGGVAREAVLWSRLRPERVYRHL